MIDAKTRWSFYKGRPVSEFEGAGDEPPKLPIEQLGKDNLVRLPNIDEKLLEALPEGHQFFSPDELSRTLPLSTDTFRSLIEFPCLRLPCRRVDNSLDLLDLSIAPDIYLICDPAEDDDFAATGYQTALTTAGRLRVSIAHPSYEASTNQRLPRPDLFKRATYNKAVMPAFRDRNGHLRLFLPRSLDVWFSRGADQALCTGILQEAGLELIQSSRPIERSLGLWRARIRGDDTVSLLRSLSNALAMLGTHDEVLLAEPDELSQGDFPPALINPEGDFQSVAQQSWHKDMIRLAEGHARTTGSSQVTIYVVDSGLDTDHPNIAPALQQNLDQWDLNFDINADAGEASPEAGTIAHGTAVASLAVGQGIHGPLGVAPGCRLVPIKIAGEAQSTGYGLRAAAIHQALNMIEHSGQKGVLNLSWRTAGEHLGIREALRRAQQMQVPVVAAAGNYSSMQNILPNDILYPAAHSYREPRFSNVVSVGAVSASLKRASYSYYGKDSVTVAAPGGEIGGPGTAMWVSTLAGGQDYMAGTSFAAPQVAGLLALLLSEGVSTQEAIRRISDNTAPLLDTQHYPLGRGLINIPAALGVPVQPPADPLGLVNINTSNADLLAALPPLTRWQAEGIVQYRSANGLYASPWHLIFTGRINFSDIESLLPLVTI